MNSNESVSTIRRRPQQTILLVEDEPSVRTLLRKMLERQDYFVLEACDGMQAEAVYSSERRPIDLIISDVRMPGMSGPEFVDRLLAASARPRVLYISGFTDEELIRHDTRSYEVLPKPFTPDVLIRKVRSAIGSPLRSRPAAQTA